MTEEKQMTTYQKVWTTLSVLPVLAAAAAALYSVAQGADDWWVFGLVVLVGGWMFVGMAKAGYDGSRALEKHSGNDRSK